MPLPMPRCLALLLLLASAPGYAAEPSGSAAHHAAQARFFLKKGWYDDARKELEAAVATQVGSQDAEMHLLLAQVCIELGDIQEAWEHVGYAVDLQGPEEVEAQARELKTWIGSTYGFLDIRGPEVGASSRLQLELQSTLFDPELKKFVNRQVLALREQTRLPVSVALPAGTYTVNGVSVEVTAGNIVPLELPRTAVGSQGLARLQVTRLEISAGFGTLFGERTSNLDPAFEIQVGLTQPVGRALVGATLDHSFRAYATGDYGKETQPGASAAGLRVGMELFMDGPFALRPGLGYRYALLPGIGADCVETRAGLECGAPGTLQWPDAQVWGVARAHVPYAEIAMDYRQGGRVNALGVGLRFAVDEYFGHLPASSEARFGDTNLDEEQTVQVLASDTAFHATGVRILSNLSIAF